MTKLSDENSLSQEKADEKLRAINEMLTAITMFEDALGRFEDDYPKILKMFQELCVDGKDELRVKKYILEVIVGDSIGMRKEDFDTVVEWCKDDSARADSDVRADWFARINRKEE